jgi:hypothetical protein
MILRSKRVNVDGIRYNIDTDTLKELIADKKFIGLIKEYRTFTGDGLKNSKDAMEECRNGTSSTGGYPGISFRLVVKAFKKRSTHVPKITREQMMNLVETAFDAMDGLYMDDYLLALEMMCKGIRKQGGTKKVVEKIENFIEAL